MSILKCKMTRMVCFLQVNGIYASLDMSISLSYSDTISIAENDSILQKMTRTRCKNIIDNIFINQKRTANIRCPLLITDRYMFLLR